MKWGNVNISKKTTDAEGKITLEGTVDVKDTDYKGTMKITWVVKDPNTNVEVNMVNLGQLITKDKISDKYKSDHPSFKRDQMKV